MAYVFIRCFDKHDIITKSEEVLSRQQFPPCKCHTVKIAENENIPVQADGLRSPSFSECGLTPFISAQSSGFVSLWPLLVYLGLILYVNSQ